MASLGDMATGRPLRTKKGAPSPSLSTSGAVTSRDQAGSNEVTVQADRGRRAALATVGWLSGGGVRRSLEQNGDSRSSSKSVLKGQKDLEKERIKRRGEGAVNTIFGRMNVLENHTVRDC